MEQFPLGTVLLGLQSGPAGPSEFIPVAEETGMIVPLGRWVLSENCRRACIFREQISPDAPLRMSANLFTQQFGHRELVEEIAAAPSETGMASPALALQITEGVKMKILSCAVSILRTPKALGVTPFMDGFGTGYSLITHLKSLPEQILKMDRTVVEGPHEDSGKPGGSLCDRVPRALGLEVVAKGVETAGGMYKLRSLDCNFAWGCYWPGPGFAEKMTELLAAGSGP